MKHSGTKIAYYIIIILFTTNIIFKKVCGIYKFIENIEIFLNFILSCRTIFFLEFSVTQSVHIFIIHRTV